MIDLEYSFFQRKTLDLVGIDLSLYKSEQMRRRLNTIMARSGAHNLFEYYRIIERDQEKQKEFRDFITINVSEFFRIPDRFEYLREYVLPTLFADRPRLRIWSAGCSIGAEPYSLAMILQDIAPAAQWQIIATDIDDTILQRARRGMYAATDLRNLSGYWLRRYFIATGEQFQIVDKIRDRIQFKRHDLLREKYEENFDLIACRHVLIYFTEEAKDAIFKAFHRSLRLGGVLFLGGTEMIRKPKEIGYESLSSSFYRRI